MDFRQFCEAHQEIEQDIKKSLSNVPSKHKNLLKNHKFKLQDKASINNDKKHVGSIDHKEMLIASPWNHSREFVFLHELAHLVWQYILKSLQKNRWKDICKKYKFDDGPEEFFCMIYSNCYAKNKLKKYDYPELFSFIEKL